MKSKLKQAAVDPVCGMEVPTTTAYRTSRNSETYYFCSEECRHRFLRHPSEYLVEREEQPAATHAASMPSVSRVSEQRAQVTTAPAEATSRNVPTPDSAGKGSWTDYIPLFVLLDVALLAASAKQASYTEWRGSSWMLDFMGIILAGFALLKLVDLEAFADAFAKYDVLGKRLRVYAYAYPFVELGLGLAYLAQWQLPFVYAATTVLYAFGAVGVTLSIRRKENLTCACVGGTVKVPLSKVTLIEDLGMVAMAAFMWATMR
jgi:YHS domain-containing protein